MRSHRPTDRSGSFARCVARRASSPLVLLLALGVMAAPSAGAKPAGKKHAAASTRKAADIAPGQMKQAAAATVSALAALVRQAAERSATAAPTATTTATATGKANAKKNSVKPSKEARKATKRAAAPAAAPAPPAVIAPASVSPVEAPPRVR